MQTECIRGAMLTATERLRTLHAEASMKHARFEKLKKRRDAQSKTVTATMAVIALATGITAGAGMSDAVTATLATLLLMATAAKLAVTDTMRDHDLQRLSDDWRRHQIQASRLLERDAVQRGSDTPDSIRRETIDLERRIAEAHGDSLLLDPE